MSRMMVETGFLLSDGDGDGVEKDLTLGVESMSLAATESREKAEDESSPLSPYVNVYMDADADVKYG